MSSLYRSILNVQSSSFASTNSFEFDGSTDLVEINNTAFNFDRLDPFTVSAWVKKNDSSGGAIVSKIQTSGNLTGWMFYFNSSNQLRLLLRRQNQTFNRLINTSVTAITIGTWNHVVCTYDGSSTEAGMNFYINGVDAGTNPNGNTLGGGTSLVTTIPLQIGARNSTDAFLNGFIDEVAIWDSELSQSDVTEIYGTGVPNNLNEITNPPISWWRMGEAANYSGGTWTLTDQGSGGNDGTSTTLPAPPAQPSTDVPT